ncbi:hypothetical protein CJ030_MR1G029183 [Morella rubra]|uniref:DUF4220 domain-containing protein n=1 Tax=Morella rubra TaxID=262757 RepID=A0A6A1WUK0_9ROSI|nr:hypothetical protein CJ030_MR1G029183 [Morella rubra]
MLTGLGPVYVEDWLETDNPELTFVKEAISSMGIAGIEVFDIIEIELGYLFDVLYTKAFLTYTWSGCILLFISSFCSFSALLMILLIVFVKEKSCHCYSNVDTSISIVLLVGAVVLEFYGIILLRSSDWPVRIGQNWLPCEIFRRLPWLFEKHKKRWSCSLGQYSLLASCFNHRTGKLCGVLERLGIDEILLDRFQHNTFVEVPVSLKSVIIKYLLVGAISSISSRGQTALEQHRCYDGKLKESTKLEFRESILKWHIATDICYHLSDPSIGNSDEEMETSKILSDYMMYLLLMHPSMFLSPAEQEELDGLLTNQRSTLIKCLKGGRPATNLREACALFRSSERLAEELINREDKWKVMQSVWAEMLCYAAIHSDKVYHLRELRRGGQFLTHLWLLFLLRAAAAAAVAASFYKSHYHN